METAVHIKHLDKACQAHRMHAHMHSYACTHACTHTHTHLDTYRRVRTHTLMCTHTHTHKGAQAYTHWPRTYTHVHKHTHTYRRVHIHTHIHSCAHTRTHTHIFLLAPGPHKSGTKERMPCTHNANTPLLSTLPWFCDTGCGYEGIPC